MRRRHVLEGLAARSVVGAMALSLGASSGGHTRRGDPRARPVHGANGRARPDSGDAPLCGSAEQRAVLQHRPGKAVEPEAPAVVFESAECGRWIRCPGSRIVVGSARTSGWDTVPWCNPTICRAKSPQVGGAPHRYARHVPHARASSRAGPMAFCIMTPIRSQRLSRKAGNSWTRRRDIRGLVMTATDLLPVRLAVASACGNARAEACHRCWKVVPSQPGAAATWRATDNRRR